MAPTQGRTEVPYGKTLQNQVSDDDLRLFTQAVGPVRPVASADTWSRGDAQRRYLDNRNATKRMSAKNC